MLQRVYKIIKSKITITAVVLFVIFFITYFGYKNSCNVYGINIHGDIVTYNSNDSYSDQGNLIYDQTSSDDVIQLLRDAENDKTIEAIVLEIDSSGGSPIAGEEIMRTLKDSNKPAVAFIRNRALSSAYMIATGAETIFGSQFSEVGSIGVTMSYLQNTEKNRKDGLTYIDLSSGKYKDSGNPDRPLSEDEKKMFMRDVKISHDYFVNLVSENRSLDIEKVRRLADGSSMMGGMALKNGLIDKIGLFSDVEKYLTEKLSASAKICWQ